MTRKKFIKMLMWAGMQRNDAAACAQLAQEAGRAYFHVLGDLLNHHHQHFKRPAINIMWLRIRGTIIHGANTPAWRFFRDIDEVHKWPMGGELGSMLRSNCSIIADAMAEMIPAVVENLVARIQQIIDTLNEDGESGRPSLQVRLGGGGYE